MQAFIVKIKNNEFNKRETSVKKFTNTELKGMLGFAERLTLRVGKLIKELRNDNLELDYKNEGVELVTSADLRADEVIKAELSSRYPGIEIYSEESHSNDIDFYAPLWIVDPIDGTVNYAHGHYNVAISIAFAVNGEIKLGAVYCPFIGELFSALEGAGAYLNKKRFFCSKTDDIKKAIVATGFPYQHGSRVALIPKAQAILANCQDIRRLGSAALDICWVACGRFDAYYETVKLWDMAAGYVIAKEAGTKIGYYEETNPKLPLEFNSSGLLVSNPILYDKFLKLLKTAK